MYHTYAVRKGVSRGMNAHFLAVDIDAARIGVVDAGYHIHKGGFSAAVFSKHRKNFTSVYREIHVIVGNYATECFGNTLHFKSDLPVH
jgi:hypothetical protein